jgi:hypothetical protein
VGFGAADTGTLLIDITYTLRDGNDPRNLVFPFYVIPEPVPEVEAGGA